MKKLTIILQLLTLFLFLQSCKEYDMIEYGEGGEINFMGDYYKGQKSKPYWVDDVKYLEYEKNFGINERGDSLLYDTLVVGVKVMGLPATYERKVVLKANPPKENALEVIFPEAYYVPADTIMASFKVVVKRPSEHDVFYTTELVFDYVKSDFSAGTEERQVYKLKAQDKVSLELWGISEEEWESEPVMLFGEWSQTKMRYMMTLLECTKFNEWYFNADNFYQALEENLWYESLEAYKSDPTNPPLLDENTGDWIEFPNLLEIF